MADLGDFVGAGGGTSPAPLNVTAPSPTQSTAGFDFTAALGTALNKLQDVGGGILASVGVGGGLATATAGANEIAAGQVRMQTAQATAEQKLKDDNLEAANRFGLTPGMPSALVVAMSRNIADTETKIMAQNAEIQQKLNTSFLSDPLQWIVNQVALPFNEEARNQNVGIVNQQLSVLSELAKRTEDQYKVNQGIDTIDSTEKLAGLSAIAYGEAKKTISDAQFKSAQLGISVASLKQAINHDQFNAVIAASNAQQQARKNDLDEKGLYFHNAELGIHQEQLQIAKIHSAIEQQSNLRAAESHDTELQIQKLTLGTMQDRQEAMIALQKKLDLTTSTYGLNRVTWQEYSITNDGPMKQLLDEGIRDPNVQAGRIGYDTVTALDKANARNLPLTTTQNMLRSKLIEAEYATIKKNGLEATFHSLDPVVKHVKLQNGIQEFVNSQYANIATTGNIFSPPPLAAVLSSSPTIANGLLAQELAPLARSDPTHVTDANEIAAAAIAKITKGEATPAQMAQEISEIYGAVIQKNNELYQYHRFAMYDMSTKDGFNTTVNTSTHWGGSDTLNMVNKAALETYLTRSVIRAQDQSTVIKDITERNAPSYRGIVQ